MVSNVTLPQLELSLHHERVTEKENESILRKSRENGFRGRGYGVTGAVQEERKTWVHAGNDYNSNSNSSSGSSSSIGNNNDDDGWVLVRILLCKL
ncbi:hypothetical protein M0802_005783 [Mischocyttarus mexicanus]|nr:hypothetical protein M0802_005783 [Mischocyttarus mexicanus]